MDQFLNSLFLKSTKDSTPNNVTPKNSVPAQIKLREIGSLTRTPASTKQLKLAAEESLIDVSRIYSESVCDIPNSARSTFLMVFSSDSKLVASTHGDHNIYITELSSGKLISTLRGHPRTPWCIAFHPTSSEVLASGCLGGQVRVWDLHGGSELWVAQSQTVIASLAFHPVHRILAIASYNEIYFWDWSTEKAFAKSITGNDKEKVRYVAFDEAGSKLITGIANMIGTKRTEWDRTWPGSGFSRTVGGSIGNVHSSSNSSVPPPPPPPPPPSDTRITTFCYRYMLARYEQLMRRYRELSGRNPHPPPSNNSSSASRGSESTRSRDVSAGTDEITASHSSMARHGSNGRVYVLLRRSVGSSANTGSQAGGGSSTVDTSTETNRCPITLTGRRRRSVGSNAAGGSGASTSTIPTSNLETLVERSPSQSPAARRRRSVGSSAPTDRPADEAGHPLASRRIPIFNTEQTRDSSTSALPFSNNCRELLERVGELRSYIQTAWMQAMRSNDNDSDSSSTAIAQLASLMAEIPGGSRQRPWRMIQTPSHPPHLLRTPAQTGETSQAGESPLTGETPRADGPSQTSETSQTDESSRIGGPSLSSETSRTDAPSQTDTPSQTDAPSSGRLTEVLAAGLRRLRHINRQLRELEGGGDPEEGEESNNLGVITEYNSLRRMEQVLLRRIEEQELQMESEVSRVRRFSSTLLTFDHDYTSTPAGRFISVTLEEALAEDSDSAGPVPSSPPLHPNNELLLENPYFRTMATSLIRDRADADRNVPENRLLFNCRNRTNTSQLSMSSSPSIAGQATTAANSSSQLHRGSNSAENSSSRPPPDLSSVRIGMQLLSRHIDNMSRLCRVRFEMVQLRQVRQMWDELQRSWIELQNAVEGSSANIDNRLSEPSTSRDYPLPSTSRDSYLRYPPSRNAPSLDLAVPSTSRGPSNSLTSQDLPSLSNSFREIGIPSTSFRDLSQPSTSRSADTSSEMSDTSPNQATPLASARREISSVTPVTSSTSGVDSEGDGSSGSYSRPPLLSFRRSARTSASKRARFESALRYFTRSNQGARGRPRTRVYGDNGLRPSTVPATDEASDDEETRSPQASSLPSQTPSLVSQNRRKRTFLPTLTTHESFASRGGRQYNGSRVSRSGNSSGSSTPIRFIRHRLGCALHRPPSSASTQTSTSRHQTSFFRTTNSRESSSQTPPFLIDASVGTEPEGDDSAEYGSAAGRLRARQALHQMIESLLDFLENDFTRNLPADALHRRIVCLYNLLQRALELTQTLIVQIMPLPSRSAMNTAGDATPYRAHSVLSPYDHRRAPLRRSSTLSTSSPPSSSSSGSESVRTIPSLQVNDAPMDDTDLENNSGLGRRGAASRPPGPIGRPPRWADLPPPGHPARIIHLSPVDDSTDDSSSSHVYIDPSFYIRCHNIGLTHRIQAWDFSDCKIPDISNGQKNVVVGECRVHNDASVDISKDGKLLVALLPSVSMGPITNTNMLGIYSLEWATLGQCLYRTVCVQNAVSVSLSPTSRHLIVGLTSKRSLMSLNIPQYLAQVCRLNGGEAKVGGEKAGNLVLMRGIKLPTNSDTISVNCIRWIPQPGAGFVYGTNTGQLKILR